MNKKLVWHGLGYAALVALYVSLIGWALPRVGKRLVPVENSLGPVLFLMLFCLSAAIVGTLLFGRPAYLALSGRKSEALWQTVFNIGWLLALTLLALVSLVTFMPRQ